jgi:hypothetical protein
LRPQRISRALQSAPARKRRLCELFPSSAGQCGTAPGITNADGTPFPICGTTRDSAQTFCWARFNAFDRRYEIRDGTGVGVGAPQFGPRRGLFFGLSKSI